MTDVNNEIALSLLDGTNGFTLNGIDPGDRSGRSVSSAGDVNGDGYDDLIIGAPGADATGKADTGETYVVYGGVSAPGTDGVLDLSALDGTNGFALAGIDRFDASGYSVSSAGDVNGDGYDDLIVGARGADPNGRSSGETYVVYGGVSAPGTDGVLDLSALDGANGFTLTGIDARDESGGSVSSAGDVNGDGYDDLIIGARLADPKGGRSGETHVVYGGTSAPGTDGVLALSDLDGANGFTINGIDPGDVSGISVSSAGDVNGDGYDDLIIGARGADPGGKNSPGETYVVYGGAIAPGAESVRDLSALDGTNGFTLTGIDARDDSGFSVSSAGDVNGDGYGDLIIGARGADPNGRSSGEAYVVYGGASAPGTEGVFELSALDGTNGFTLIGIDPDDESGHSVSSAGDVNGDGYDDLIIGAFGSDPNGDRSGESYVVYGGASAPGTEGVFDLSALDGTSSFTINGIDRGDDSGFSVSSAGDVNGDGYDDLIIGAPRADPNGPSSGETYVVYGGANDNDVILTSPTSASVAENPDAGRVAYTAAARDAEGDVLTYSLSGTDADLFTIDPDTGEVRFRVAPDFENPADDNGDNVYRVAVTASDGENSTNRAIAITVTDINDEIALSLLDGTNGFTLNGIDPGDRSGRSVSSAGDVNGDGYDDLIIGAPGADPGGKDSAGETYVVYGEASAPGTAGLLDLSALDGSNGFTLAGIDRFDASGYSVSSAGDVNGDGYDDLIIGARGADPNGRSSGETYVVYGGEVAPGTDGVLVLSALDGANGFTLTGIDARDESGGSVSSAGDVNGDGYDDLIIGARLADPKGGRSGETHVVYGGTSAPGTDGVLALSDLDGANGFTLTGVDPGDVSGISVSSAGDVNGDGYDDLIIGARGADPGGKNSPGETYVVYGGAIAPGAESVRDLSALDGTNGFTLTGIDARDDSGFSVSSAGDVNGDGYGDLIIGARGADPNGRSSGESYVVYGGASAPGTEGVFELSALDGTNGFTLIGIDPDDESGHSVSSAGDVNGDGYDDLIIGAFGSDPNGDRSGETYVVYGGASAPGTEGVFDLSALDGATGFMLNGIDRGDDSGFSVSSAGDVNGDGYDDLIIGAPRADPNGRSSGETYVVHGRANDNDVTFISPNSASVAEGQAVAYTAAARDAGGGALTYSLSGTDAALFTIDPDTGEVRFRVTPDFENPADDNGDNVYRVAVTASGGENSTDRAIAITVTDVNEIALSMLDGSNGFALTGIDPGDRSGRSVSSAGDVNGDGYDDLVIGAPGADANGKADTGETYVVYGGAGAGGVLALSALDGTNGFTLVGIDRFDASGYSVSSAGDVNGDGYDDLIIGARGADPNGRSSGETYVVYGGEVAPGTDGVLVLSALDGADGFTLTGIDARDESGASVSSAGDVNGDGYDDLIIGARLADPNGSRSGESYVVYGGEVAPGTDGVLALSDLDGANGFILAGIDPGDVSGISVSSAGDVNGDGYDDLIIGARLADPSGKGGAGETYVVYGGVPGGHRVLELSALDGTNGFTLNGIDLRDYSGVSVSSAGDVNGDGYGDLIIGARGADPNGEGGAGETYVVYGGASAPGTEGVFELSALDGTNGFTLIGIDPDDESGHSVSSAGDVNGDGYDDLIIGAYEADPNGDRSGETYVVYGGAVAPGTGGVLDLSTPEALDGTNGFILNGIDRGDDSGFSVSSAGDVNGDGYDDLIIGAPRADPNGRSSGETYVVYGGANDNDVIFTSPTSASVAENPDAERVVYTAAARDAEGAVLTYSLSGTDAALFTIDADTGEVRFRVAPDFENPADDNRDNVYRVAVTASDGENSTNRAITITVTDVNDEIALSMLDGTNGFTLNGIAGQEDFIDPGDRSGVSVSSAGDVNGDGYDDLIVGAWGADPAGEAYVIYGGASAPGANGVLELSGLDGTNGFILAGIDLGDFSGRSVSSAGDVNGDGYDDLIVGAWGADPGGKDFAGETYVIYGGASAPGANGVLELSGLDGTNGFILAGIDARNLSGYSVSSAGDVNGDGYDDLIIGATGADPNGESNAGETYVVYGAARAPGTDGVLDLSDLDGANGFTLTGVDPGDVSGGSVSSAGDVNGDGYDDLIIGAYFAAPNGKNLAGETYVVYGGPGTDGVLALSALDGTNGFTLTGIDPEDRSGGSVSSAGDVNGDGYDDLIIGAREADPSGRSSGETYVVYGGVSAPGTDGVLELSALDGTNGFTLNGISPYDNSGVSVSSAGDVNGDGYDDLIIGARGLDPDGESYAGETYVVYGGASAPGTDGVLTLSALDGTNGFTLSGIDPGDRSGYSVSSAGDVNGDGYDDLIIGAYRADPNGEIEAGETYVVHGGATGTESTVPVTAQGTVSADNFTGNAGADTFTEIGTGDVVRGGAGDDSISVTSLDFAHLDGGTGRDTLVLTGPGLSLDLTHASAADVDVDSVEVLDLSGAGAHRLALDALALFDLTEERDGGMATLDVLGDADDVVVLSVGNFIFSSTETEAGATYSVYRDGNAEVRVQDGVVVTLAPVFFTSVGHASVAENESVESVVYAAVARDTDGNALTYSLSGMDAVLFTVDANTGEVRFRVAPDFENPADDDGDNVYDITVTASDGESSTNLAVTITVTDVNEIALSMLDGADGFALTGIDRGDDSGGSVSSAGDVNGDGYDDLIIGAYMADPNGKNRAGETYVVYGGASAPGADGVLALSALDGTNGFTLTGIGPDDLSGRSVSSAGDVNGDGYDDLVVGALGADSNGLNSGETYVVYGGASAPGADGVLALSALDGTNGFTLTGTDADDFSGTSVSSAGDVNGDGYDDLIIGARGADPNGEGSGETYVVYGGASAPGTGGVLDLSALDGTNGFTLKGIDRLDYSGTSVSSAGDVNGDGYDDLIIGADGAAPNGLDSGESYVVYGGASTPGANGVVDLSALDGMNGFTLSGIDPSDRSGGSVSSAGDVNGDGYDDLIIGADWADPNGVRSGETYVVYGGASAPGADGVLELSALNGTNGFTLTGIDPYDESGTSVSSAGDVNGDGYDDLLIGAYEADPNGVRSGETYLVYGGASAPGTGGVLELSALDGTNGFTLKGIDRLDYSGTSVSSAGDVNGDGYDDLIVGATGADPHEVFDAGETYVVYGGATGTESTVPVTAQGTVSADNFNGNAGADTFTEIATDDVVRGGAGDDSISVNSLDFAHLDGGTGRDTLVLTGSDLSLDLTGAGAAGVDVGSVEVLDLSGTGADTLVLDALAVFDVTEERDDGMATLDVRGDADDTVDLSGGNFMAIAGSAETEDGTTYSVYRDGNAEVRVQDGVVVTLAASESASLGQSGSGGGDGASQVDGLQSLGRSDSHGLNEAPVFDDLSVRESIPDMQAAAAGEDDVLMPFPLPSVVPMPQSVLEGGAPTPIRSDLDRILQEMEMFTSLVTHVDTEMDGS